MIAAWSLLLMLGWFPANGTVAQGPALSVPESRNIVSLATVSMSEQLERDQHQALALGQSA